MTCRSDSKRFGAQTAEERDQRARDTAMFVLLRYRNGTHVTQPAEAES
jgi:hypothetical protein